MSLSSSRRFSVIIPVYNRPEELAELLECLAAQTLPPFEVVVVDDGSAISSRGVAESFGRRLNISYFEKENEGQGYTRNYAMKRAKGDFFIILDSDALLEPDYLSIVDEYLNKNRVDFYGGPDTDHPNFTPIQKAISYSMTSVFTTGGIRGRKNNLGGAFHPRSFNMGISREVWERTGGFKVTRMGEDIIFSISAIRMGFKSALIPEAFIYHKRRTRFSQFFRQLKFFGRARINIARFYPEELKAVHFFPALFLVGLLSIPLALLLPVPALKIIPALYLLYFILLFADAWRTTKKLDVAALSVVAATLQLSAYGIGFIGEGWRRILEPGAQKNTGAAVEYPS
ncbi:glycosyltransferase [Ravibacter arvi]|uniref:Glycosyltransferase n=1 Tax=Ravibacter arvi TaxID=2051041 RepID=A0ABP8LYC3_9BACT